MKINSKLIILLLSIGFVMHSKMALSKILYVVDNTTTSITEFSLTGVNLGTFANTGLNNPNVIIQDSSGNFYVTNAPCCGATIEKYSATGADLGVFANAGVGQPRGFVQDSSGNFYVCYTGSNKIEKFSSTGTDLGAFANTGTVPTGIARDSSGNFYVTYVLTNTIEKFSPTGVDLGVFANTGLNSPQAIIIDNSGNFIVVNFNNTMEKFSPTGVDLGVFANTGLNLSRGITEDSSGNFYVTNPGNNTIEKFSQTGTDLGLVANDANLPQGLFFAAQTLLWTGGGADNNLGTTSNWSISVTPDPAGPDIFFAGNTRTTPNNASLNNISSITFNAGASPFTLTGNSFTLLNGITNNSSNLQTIGLSGTLSLGGSQTWNAASGSLAVTNAINTSGYALTVTGANTTTLSGAISGTGSLVMNGTGTLALSGSNSYTGGTTVTSGTLQGNSNSIQGNVINNSLVVFNQAFNGTYAGNMSGTGGVLKQSSGIVTFSGNNTYTGGTVVTGGTLILSGINASPGGTMVNPGSTLSAAPRALSSGNLMVLGGTLQGASAVPQTMSVGGNYTQTGGTLALRLGGSASSNQYDALNVTGNATLSGNLLVTTTAGFTPQAGQTYTLIQARSLSGTFSSFTLPGDPPYLSYTSSGVFLVYPLPFAVVGASSGANQQAIGGALDQFSATASGDASTLITSLYAFPSTQQEANALSQLSPQRYELLQNVSLEEGYSLANQVEDHVQALRRGTSGFDLADASFLSVPDLSETRGVSISHFLAFQSCETCDQEVSDGSFTLHSPDKPWSFFLRGNLLSDTFTQRTDLTSSNFRTGGITAGVDARISDHWTAGILFGYAHTNANMDTQGSLGQVDMYLPGIYAAYLNGPFYLDFLGTYGQNVYKMNRQVLFSGFSRNALAQTTGNQNEWDVRGGYDVQKSGWSIGPRFGLQSTNANLLGFSENGAGVANLSLAGEHVNSLRSQLGVRVTVNQVWGMMPHLDIRWQHEYRDGSQAISGNFSQTGSGVFTVQTDLPERNMAVIDVGLESKVSHSGKLFLDYAVETGAGTFFSQNLRGGFDLKW